jgi:hypothetical protein
MTPAQQQTNPALSAIRTILSRQDHIPAAAADKDLGYLKSILRKDSSSDQVKYFAGKAIDALDKGVQDAVTQAGPDAITALNRGRAATITKYAARDVLDDLREEPVQAFNQALWRNDAGIDQLRAVQKFAPSEMPKLGRAFVDDLISKATSEGDFSKQASLWNRWQSLGPETKKIIFSDPALRGSLDDFFLLAKKMSENPNPSGTGHVISMLGQGGALLTAPHIAIPIEIGGAVLSRLLHSPATVRLLIRGMTFPATGGNAASAIASQIMAASGKSKQSENGNPYR